MVDLLTCVHRHKSLQWAHEHMNWSTEQWKKEAWSDELRFPSYGWQGACITYLGKRGHHDVLWKEDKLEEAWCQIPQRTLRDQVGPCLQGIKGVCGGNSRTHSV